MACHEFAALRLALHSLLGDRPAHERTHEEQDLGSLLTTDGPLRALAEATDLAQIRTALDAAALDLEHRVADMAPERPDLGYWRALLVNVKRTQADLLRLSAWIEGWYHDIDEIHGVLHETFPESD